MAVEVDFGQVAACRLTRVFLFDDLGVAGRVVGVGEVVMDAPGKSALRDELGQTMAVGIVGEVDDAAIGADAADETVVEAVGVGGCDR